MTKYCLLILHPFVIIAEEISSIKSSSYGVSSIILNYSVFTLEAIIAAQSPLHCHFSITSFHWNAIELCNYCTKVNRVVPPLCTSYHFIHGCLTLTLLPYPFFIRSCYNNYSLSIILLHVSSMQTMQWPCMQFS